MCAIPAGAIILAAAIRQDVSRASQLRLAAVARQGVMMPGRVGRVLAPGETGGSRA
jgi:hypothetical protein